MFDPALQAARLELQVPMLDLWTRYFTFGGNLDVTDIDAYLTGLVDVADIDHDLIAQALNEVYLENGRDHPLPYLRP